MIREFLEAGYSVQWKVLKAQDYGVPQIRERLIVLASWSFHCYPHLIASPGQPLPDFPLPTHGPPPLPPYVSLAAAINNINPKDRLHDVRPYPRPRYSCIDPYLPFPGTIMASGNTSHIFPDGSRPFTKRELARCQTFSDAHVFGNTRIERQSRLMVDLTDV